MPKGYKEGSKFQSPSYMGDMGNKNGGKPESSEFKGKLESPAYGSVSKGEKNEHKNGR